MSVRSNGNGADQSSWNVDISANGKVVAFASDATNLVGNDDNGVTDVFVHDRETEKTTRVSVSSNGGQANGSSGYNAVAISANGRFVAFDSGATDLVANDGNFYNDIFVHDRNTGKTRRVSLRTNGDEGNGNSYHNVDISANGNLVAFSSDAKNLVGNDDNDGTDVFVHNRETGTTRRVSVSSNGGQASGYSGYYSMAMTPNGRFVAFDSGATDLVANDGNIYNDIFLHDRKTGSTRLVSLANNGDAGDEDSYENVDISADGHLVAFSSEAQNLVGNDTLGLSDVFVRNRKTDKTRRVSVRSNGDEADADSGLGNGSGFRDTMLRMSASGRFVAFTSAATNLVAGDTLGYMDVFVHDLKTGNTRRVSIKANGDQGNNGSGLYGVAMTPDGKFVGYTSFATNLAPGDANGSGSDIYLSGPLF